MPQPADGRLINRHAPVPFQVDRQRCQLDVEALRQQDAGALPRRPAEGCRSGSGVAAVPTGGRYSGTAVLANGWRCGTAMLVSGNGHAAERISGNYLGKARAACTWPLSAEPFAAGSITFSMRCLAAACHLGSSVPNLLFAGVGTTDLITRHFGNDVGNENLGPGSTAACHERAGAAVVAAAATCGMPLAGKMAEAQSG